MSNYYTFQVVDKIGNGETALVPHRPITSVELNVTFGTVSVTFVRIFSVTKIDRRSNYVTTCNNEYNPRFNGPSHKRLLRVINARSTGQRPVGSLELTPGGFEYEQE